MFITWKKSISEPMFMTFFHPYNEWNMLLKFGQLFLKHPITKSHTHIYIYIYI